MNEILKRQPLARALVYTPTHLALEAAARLFPVFRAEPLVVDEFPLMTPPSAGVLNPSAARAKRVAEREPWGWGPTALIGDLP